MFEARLGGIRAIALAACVVLVAGAVTADTVVITPTKDNSMFLNFNSNESNGAGVYLYAGRSGCCGPRRALLAFDVASNVPAGATIDSVSLQMTVSKVPILVEAVDVGLHPVTADWGEGASDAGDPGGFGAPAEPGDATWDFRFFNTDTWATPGGDFGAVSATTTLLDLGNYTWSSPAMAADVQSWLNAPGSNFGWIFVGDESGFNGNARRFNSRENGALATVPQLTINFTAGAVCGDGVLDATEECDDGNNEPGDGCDADCVVEFCGDGIVQGDEQCDDGNNEPGDGCDDVCVIEFCGDGIVQGDEQCDDGNSDDGDGCSANCTIEAVCGDGIVQGDEQCDDGNNEPGDGCDANCVIEFCGDGIVQGDEQCDDGNNEPGDGCDDVCVTEFCGDGIVQGDEQCDDGNVAGGDGCEADCTLLEPVPTMSEWGLILMALLLLTAGTILFGRREVAGAGVGGSTHGTGIGRIPFDLRGYRNALALCASLLAIGFGVAWAALGAVTAVDLGGSLVALPVVAYLVHLWTMPRRD